MSALIKQAGAWAVNKFLSELLTGVTSDTFILDFGSGSFGVRDVQLNLKHFKDIESPLDIKHVSLGEVKLEIPAPWKLLREPIKVKVDKLFVVVGARNVSGFTIDQRKEMMKATKKLALFVMGMVDGIPQPPEYVDKEAAIKSKKKLLEPELFGLPGIVKRLIPIVDNVQVEIANIHIRYEDAQSRPAGPIAIGLCLDNLAIRGSTNRDGQDTLVTEWNIDNFRKVCLSNFSLYIDTEGKTVEPVSSSPQSELHSLIYRGSEAPHTSPSEHQFALQPLSINAGVQWHRGYDIAVPMVQADLLAPHLGLTISHAQYAGALNVATHYDNYNARLKFGYLSPPEEPARINPRAWWVYVLGCVRRRVRHRLKGYKAENIARRLADRSKYINITREMIHLGSGWVPETDKQALEELERRLKYRDTILFRKIAKLSLLRQSKEGKIPTYGMLDKMSPAVKIGLAVAGALALSLIASIYLPGKMAIALFIVAISAAVGGGYKKIFAKPSIPPLEVHDLETWGWIYDQLKFHPQPNPPKVTPVPVLPADYALAKFKALIPRIQLDLNLNLNGSRPYDTSLVTLSVDGVQASGSVGDPTISVQTSIDSLNALERISLPQQQPLPLLSHIFSTDEPIDEKTIAEQRFLNLQLLMNPRDRPNVDIGVQVVSTTFNLNVGIPLVNAMLGFFIPPTNKREVKELTKVGIHRMAVAGVDSIKAAVRDRLCIALDVRLAGPTVTLAQTYKPQTESQALFVRLGAITISSNPRRVVDPDHWTEDDCFDLYKVNVTDMSINLLKGVWYSPMTARNFAVSLESPGALVEGLLEESENSEIDKDASLVSQHRLADHHLIKPIAISLNAFVCIAGNIPDVPATRLVGDVSPVELLVSPSRVHRILSILSAQFPAPVPKAAPKIVKSLAAATGAPSSSVGAIEQIASASASDLEHIQTQYHIDPLKPAPASEIEDESGLAKYTNLKLPAHRPLLLAAFSIQSVAVHIIKDPVVEKKSKNTKNRMPQILATVMVGSILADVDMNPYIISVASKVQFVHLEEFVDETHKIVPTSVSQPNRRSLLLSLNHPDFGAVSVGLKVVPKLSPIYEYTMMDILVNVGHLEVNVIRPALLAILSQALTFIPAGYVFPAIGISPTLPTESEFQVQPSNTIDTSLVPDVLAVAPSTSQVEPAQLAPEATTISTASDLTQIAAFSQPSEPAVAAPEESPKPTETTEEHPDPVEPLLASNPEPAPTAVEPITHTVEAAPATAIVTPLSIDTSPQETGDSAQEMSPPASAHSLHLDSEDDGATESDDHHAAGDPAVVESEAELALYLMRRENEATRAVAVRANVPSVRVNLVQESSTLTHLEVNRICLAVDVRGDGQLRVQGFVEGLDVSAHYEGLNEVSLVSVNRGKLAQFELSVFKSEASDFPGYELAVSVTVGVLEVTYYHLIVMKLVAWSLNTVETLMPMLDFMKQKPTTTEVRKSRRLNRKSLALDSVPAASTPEKTSSKRLKHHTHKPSTEADDGALESSSASTSAATKKKRRKSMTAEALADTTEESVEESTELKSPRKTKSRRERASMMMESTTAGELTASTTDDSEASTPKRTKSLRKSESTKKKRSKRSRHGDAVVVPARPMRIKIAAHVESPMVTIPVNPLDTSAGSIVVNLGKIEVSNVVEETLGVITDTLTAQVSHLNIVFIMPKGVESIGTMSLLDHSGVKAVVQRVLFGDDKHSIPAIGVDVELLPLHVTFGTPQLELVFQLLAKHIMLPIPQEHELADYFESRSESDKAAAQFEARMLNAMAVQERVAKFKAERGESADPLSPSDGSYTSIRVVARISSFAIDLCDEQCAPQLRIGVKQIGALAAIANDGHITFEAALAAVDILDLVISFDHFNAFFGKPVSVIDPMIQLAFVLNPNANAMGVKVGVHSPVIAVIPDTVLRCKNTWEGPIMTGLRTISRSNPSEDGNGMERPTKPTPVASVSGQPAVPDVTPSIKCTILVSSPRIAIVPAANDLSTLAFTINLGEMSLNADLDLASRIIDATLGVTHVSLIRSIITAGTLASTNEQFLLHPLELKATASIHPDSINTAALIPTMQFIASFRDVELVMKILEAYQPLLAAFAPPPAPGSTMTNSTMTTTEVTSTKMSDAVLSTSSAVEDALAAQAADAPRAQSLNLSLEITSIDIAVIDDRFKSEFFVPLLRFNLSPLKGKVNKEASLTGGFSFHGIQASVYNRQYSGWEPLIEPWEMNIGFTQDSHGMAAALNAATILEMTVNQSLLVCVFELLEIVAPPKSTRKKSQAVALPSADPLVIRNWSGEKLTLQLEDNTDPFGVSLGESRPLTLKRQTRSEAVRSPPNYTFSLHVAGATAPARLTANRVDTVVVPYRVEDPNSCYIAEIATIQGSRTITIRGAYKVTNTTSVAMDLMIVGAQEEKVYTIEPNGGSFSASIAQSAARLVKVRAHGFDWSETIDFMNPKSAYILRCKETVAQPTGFDWFGTARVDVNKDGEDFSLVIAPPVNIENLFTVPIQVKFVNLKREKENLKAAAKEEKLAKKSEKDKTSIVPSSSASDLAGSSSSVLRVDAEHLSAMPTWDIIECDDADIHTLPSFDETLAICLKLPDYGWSKPTPFVSKIDLKRTDKFDTDLVASKFIELPDVNGTMLKIGIDTSTTDTAARNIKLYATTWIVNDTGLPLFFKKDKDDKQMAAGQSTMPGYEIRVHTDSSKKGTDATSNTHPSLLDHPDQHKWYKDMDQLLVGSTAPNTSNASVSTSLQNSSVSLVGSSASINQDAIETVAKSISLGYGPYFYFGEKRVSIALENSNWSSSSDLGVRDEGTIDIEDTATGRLYSFFILVRPAPARFWRTSIVRIYPRFVINNTSQYPLILRQIHESHDSPTCLHLEPGTQLPYHFPSYKKDLLMAAHVAGSPHLCTSYFGLDQVGRFPLRFHDTSVGLERSSAKKYAIAAPVPIPSSLDENVVFAGLNITNMGDASIFVRLLPDAPEEYFTISNQTSLNIVVREAQSDPTLKLLKKAQKAQQEAVPQPDGPATDATPSPSHTAEDAATATASPAKSEKELAKDRKAAEKAAEKEKKAADKAAKQAEKDAKQAEKEAERRKKKASGAIPANGDTALASAEEVSSEEGESNDSDAPVSAATSSKKKKKKEEDAPAIEVQEDEAEARGAQGYILKAKRKEAFMFPRAQHPKHKVQFQLPGDTTWHTVNLDKIQVLPSVKLGDKKYLHIRTVAVGQSKQLIVKIAEKQAKSDEEQLKATEGHKMSVDITMAGLGISIVDQTPQELMYLRLGDLKVSASMSAIEQTLELKLGMLQVDNDLYLTPQSIIAHSLDQPEGDPFFHLAVVRDMRYQKFFCFRYFSMKMHKLATRLDMAFALNAMCWALTLTKWINKRTSAEIEHAVILGAGEGKIKTPQISATSNGFYFEVFHLNPMAFQISFTPSSNFDCPNIDDTGTEMIAKISPHLITIDEAPLFLGGLLMTNCFTSQDEFIARLTSHYVKSVLKQLFMLVGSSDALGNPVSLVNSLGTGVYDLVHEPAEGATQSPAQFGIGIAKGTGSLLKNSLGGVLATAEKLVGNVSKLGEKLSMDKEYQQEREKMKLKKAHHVGTGLTYGFKELGTGLFQGVSGLVTQPVKGAKSKGLKGFATGLGKGLVGVVVKPTVGVVDLVTRTTEGIRNTGSDHKTVPRVRDPRFIGADLLIPSYSATKSAGQLLLRTLSSGKYAKAFYAWHKAPTSKSMILVTNTNLIYLKVNALEKVSLSSEKWGIEFNQPLIVFSDDIQVDEAKNRIVLSERSSSNLSGPSLRASTTTLPPTAEAVVEESASQSDLKASSSSVVSPSKKGEKLKEYRIKYEKPEEVQIIVPTLIDFIREAPVSRPRAKALSLLKQVGNLNPISLLIGGSDKKKDKSKDKKDKTSGKDSANTTPSSPSKTDTASLEGSMSGEAPTEAPVTSTTLKRSVSEKESKRERRRSISPGDAVDPIEDSKSSHKREKMSKRAETIAVASPSKDSPKKEKEKEKHKDKESHKEKRKSKLLAVSTDGQTLEAGATQKSPRKSMKLDAPPVPSSSDAADKPAEQPKSPRRSKSSKHQLTDDKHHADDDAHSSVDQTKPPKAAAESAPLSIQTEADTHPSTTIEGPDAM
jgi:hypothetical protein